MTGIVSQLAADLGVSPVTLRRAIAIGLVRAERPSPRKAEISVGERVYLREYWPLLSALRAALRSEPRVQVAVLYGSQARGSAGDSSDVDMAVLAGGAERGFLYELQTRLSAAVGREVAVTDLADAMASPRMRPQLLEDGRTLVQRGDIRWRQLRAAKGWRHA